MDDQLRCLLAQVENGGGAVVAGPSIAAGRLCADAAAAMVGRAEIVLVATPREELTLSDLIAQLSGQSDVGGQDDAVLELGFKRLTGPAPTLLMLLAPCGISPSALRFVQHVARQAPQLGIIVLGSPPLLSLLAEPGYAGLRTRLQAAAPIEAASVPAAASPQPATARRSMVWTSAAIGLAAILAIVAWFGHAAPRAEAVGLVLPPSIPAIVPIPKLAAAPVPVLAKPLALAASTPVKPVPVMAPRVAAGTVPIAPPVARGRPPLRAASNRYAGERGAAWVRRVWRERETRYYAVDPYGRPYFGYYP